LLAATVSSAISLAGEATAPFVSVPVATLTEEVVKSMMTSKLKAAVGIVVLVAGIGLGSAVAWPPGDARQQATGAETRSKPAPRKKSSKVPEYVIEPPDVLLVKYGDPKGTEPVKISGSCLVRPDGTIGLGVLGPIQVSDLTIEQARRAVARHLKERLDSFDDSKLLVEIQSANSKVFYLVVKEADNEQIVRFPMKRGQTVLDAIASIPQLLLGLGKKRISLHRKTEGKGKVILPVNWRAITQDGYPATNYSLRAGDQVHIEPVISRPAAVLLKEPGKGPLPPSEKDVLRALPKGWANGKDLSIVYESQGSRVDEPRFYPLLGPARMTHARWKCTAYSEDKVKVVYLDVDYLVPSE
jgi:protein involved in polysaccharide export with SLBB domain